MKDIIKSTKNIYNHLEDEKSKFIFENRIMYSLTKDYKYIFSILKSVCVESGLDRAVDFCKKYKDDVVIYGTGNDLSVLSVLYPDFKFRYLCDTSPKKQQEGWRGIPIMSPKKLIERKNEVYVAVNSLMYHKEIVTFLLENGFNQDNIIDFGNFISVYRDTQYFDSDIMIPKAKEIFIDGGCFNCFTDKAFIDWCSNNYEKIYAFEPDIENYKKCLEECRKTNIKNFILYNKGLWNCETELSFQESGNAGSKIGEGTNTISTVSIDKIVENKPVSFIKLDVEGAELEALQGAKKTIEKNHPKMAICVYHKPQDIIDIPDYILSLCKDYKLYFRHYSMNQCETVMYAV